MFKPIVDETQKDSYSVDLNLAELNARPLAQNHKQL